MHMQTRWSQFLWLICFFVRCCCRVGGFVSLPCECSKIAFKARWPLNMSEDEEKRSQILDEMTRKMFGNGNIPTNPFAQGFASARRGLSSADLYDEDELFNVLQVHTQLAKTRAITDKESTCIDGGEPASVPPSLHELVLQTTNVEGNDIQIEAPSGRLSDNSWMDNKTRNTISNICAIASDVDGTLLSSRQSLHPRTRQAVLRAMKSVASVKEKLQYFFPATGKTRKGALDSLGPEIGSQLINGPGVYIQGLYCVDGAGNVVFEQKLNRAAIEACEELVKQNAGLSAVAYDGDNIYSTELTPKVIELHERYGEPMAQRIESFAVHDSLMHKILVMDDDVSRLKKDIRPKLEALAGRSGASVTQAIPTMLELIPEGCSKAQGVTKLCEALGIDPTKQLLAIGDAENDAEMLEMAALGVAVGNACSVAKESADFVMDETNDEGGAGCAMEIFGLS